MYYDNLSCWPHITAPIHFISLITIPTYHLQLLPHYAFCTHCVGYFLNVINCFSHNLFSYVCVESFENHGPLAMYQWEHLIEVFSSFHKVVVSVLSMRHLPSLMPQMPNQMYVSFQNSLTEWIKIKRKFLDVNLNIFLIITGSFQDKSCSCGSCTICISSCGATRPCTFITSCWHFQPRSWNKTSDDTTCC